VDRGARGRSRQPTVTRQGPRDRERRKELDAMNHPNSIGFPEGLTAAFFLLLFAATFIL